MNLRKRITWTLGDFDNWLHGRALDDKWVPRRLMKLVCDLYENR